MMMVAREIDDSARLMTWDEKMSEMELEGTELKLMPSTSVIKYIDSPTTQEYNPPIPRGRFYYQQGVRLRSRNTVHNFVEKWNNYRYSNKEKHPVLQVMSMKCAEMQGASTAYPIGYFKGTTERGKYTTVKEEIAELGPGIEASYQMIHQKGMSNEIWQQAKELAEEDYPNPYSKEHKQVKFKFAPAGLVVYVADPDKISKARREMFKKYSTSGEDGQWPAMRDGSRMKFVPMIQGSTNNDTLYNILFNALRVQSLTKGYETNMTINIKDIFTPKPYFHNRTLENIIHSTTSNTEGKIGIPLFKHILRKWTRDAEIV